MAQVPILALSAAVTVSGFGTNLVVSRFGMGILLYISQITAPKHNFHGNHWQWQPDSTASISCRNKYPHNISTSIILVMLRIYMNAYSLSIFADA
jgi:hypothetical protein